MERDYRLVSVEEIAETTRVTRGALYWHLRETSDLLLEMFIRLCDLMCGGLIHLTLAIGAALPLALRARCQAEAMPQFDKASMR